MILLMFPSVMVYIMKRICSMAPNKRQWRSSFSLALQVARCYGRSATLVVASFGKLLNDELLRTSSMSAASGISVPVEMAMQIMLSDRYAQ